MAESDGNKRHGDGRFEWPPADLTDPTREPSGQRSPVRTTSAVWPSSANESTGRRTTVGLFQYAPQERTLQDNVHFLSHELAGVTDAAIVLPEFFLGSYTDFRPTIQSKSAIAQTLQPLQAVTRANRLTLVGSVPWRAGDTTANGIVVIRHGITNFTRHTKQLLYGAERDELTSRPESGVMNFGDIACTVQVCMDIVDPIPSRQAVDQGARAILGPAAVSVDYLRTIHKARSLENQVVSVFCNRCGKESDGIEYMGGSAIFVPDGSELAAPRDEEQILLAHIDFSRVVGYREKFGLGAGG